MKCVKKSITNFLFTKIFYFINILHFFIFLVMLIFSISLIFLKFPEQKIILYMAISKCNKNGFLRNGIKSYEQFYSYSLPSIYDVMYDYKQLIVILSLHPNHFYYFATPNDKYNQAKWFCKFKHSNYIIKNIFNVNDSMHRIKVLKFPVSLRIIEQSNGIVDVFTPDFNITYLSVPFCTIPRITSKYFNNFAALCTEIISTPHDDVLKWLTYHISQGFNHAFIYVNDNSFEKMKYDLFWVIKAGFLTLVDWSWPQKKKFQDQVPGITSCLYRNKNHFSWIGFNDIDEFFSPKNGTVFDILKKYEHMRNKIGSLAAPNRFLIKSKKFSAQFCSRITKPPFRQKIIVNPDNADYIHVHRVTQGGKEIVLNDLTNVHLKTLTILSIIKYKIFRMTFCSIPSPNLKHLDDLIKE